MGDRAFGVDVSHWHTVTNWALLAARAAFIGIKATQGEKGVDTALAQHQRGFLGSTLPLGIYYHFATAGDPVAQAKHFSATVGTIGPRERLCLDLERDITDLTWVDAFFRELLAGACVGARPLIYTSSRIWKTLGDPAWDLASEVDLWAPRYSADEPVVPAPWARWAFWQFSEAYTIPGVDGQCDANWFCGDTDALATYLATGVLPALAPASPTTS